MADAIANGDLPAVTGANARLARAAAVLQPTRTARGALPAETDRARGADADTVADLRARAGPGLPPAVANADTRIMREVGAMIVRLGRRFMIRTRQHGLHLTVRDAAEEPPALVRIGVLRADDDEHIITLTRDECVDLIGVLQQMLDDQGVPR